MSRPCRLTLSVLAGLLVCAPAVAHAQAPAPSEDPAVIVLAPGDDPAADDPAYDDPYADDPGYDDPAYDNPSSGDPAQTADPPWPAVTAPGATPPAGRVPSPSPIRKTNPKAISALPRLSGPTVPGTTAQLRADGTAIPPAAAPLAVKRMIWTANRMIGLRYRWGGGHRSFADSGYDCSGAVSYVLHAASLLDWPMVSGELARWGRPGAGRWVTVYAHRTHTFVAIAGLRLDTSAVADPGGASGPRWRPRWRPSAGFHRRHPAGL